MSSFTKRDSLCFRYDRRTVEQVVVQRKGRAPESAYSVEFAGSCAGIDKTIRGEGWGLRLGSVPKTGRGRLESMPCYGQVFPFLAAPERDPEALGALVIGPLQAVNVNLVHFQHDLHDAAGFGAVGVAQLRSYG
jgi:hypothetical protein